MKSTIKNSSKSLNETSRVTSYCLKILLFIIYILPIKQIVDAKPSIGIAEKEFFIDSTSACVPEVRVILGSLRWHFCLATMTPENDSCAKISISGYGTNINFSYNSDSGWQYSGIKSIDTFEIVGLVRVDLTSDINGKLIGVLIHSSAPYDSNIVLPVKGSKNDIPFAAIDTNPDGNLSVMRIVHKCHPKKQIVTLEIRTWTYPPGYRRRYVQNCPEMTMFHYGGSVRMPTRKSLEKRAHMFCEYHQTTLSELVFDNPEEIMEMEALRNRFGLNKRKRKKKTKKRRKPPLISFKPIR